MILLCGRTRCWLAVLWLGLAGRVLAADPPPVATNLWSVKLGQIGSQSSPALAADGTIYQATFDGRLLAVSPAGKIRWQFATGTTVEIKASPAIADNGTVYFGARNRKFYAVLPDGRLKWTFATGAWVDSSAAIAADGTICFGGWDKMFYALDPAGAVKWSYAVGAVVVSSPAIAVDGTIYFGAFDKYLYALTPAGKLKWRFATGAEITASPAIGSDGTVYIPSVDGNLYAVRPDGTERWHFRCGSFTESSPVLDEAGNVYLAGIVVAGNDAEYRVTPTGRGHTVGGLACEVEVAAAAVTGRVYWSRPWRNLQAFAAAPADQGDAELLWTAAVEANLTSSPVVGADGVVYFTADRYLYALQPVGPGLPAAKSSWPMFRANARHTGRVGTGITAE
jgi:outer membrane protein assembly factor BamB